MKVRLENMIPQLTDKLSGASASLPQGLSRKSSSRRPEFVNKERLMLSQPANARVEIFYRINITFAPINLRI